MHSYTHIFSSNTHCFFSAFQVDIVDFCLRDSAAPPLTMGRCDANISSLLPLIFPASCNTCPAPCSYPCFPGILSKAMIGYNGAYVQYPFPVGSSPMAQPSPSLLIARDFAHKGVGAWQRWGIGVGNLIGLKIALAFSHKITEGCFIEQEEVSKMKLSSRTIFLAEKG